MGGIDVVTAQFSPRGKSLCTALCLSGGYQDDRDCGGEIWYTGEGGNDFLGLGTQYCDQKMKRGNMALMVGGMGSSGGGCRDVRVLGVGGSGCWVLGFLGFWGFRFVGSGVEVGEVIRGNRDKNYDVIFSRRHRFCMSDRR